MGTYRVKRMVNRSRILFLVFGGVLLALAIAFLQEHDATHWDQSGFGSHKFELLPCDFT